MLACELVRVELRTDEGGILECSQTFVVLGLITFLGVAEGSAPLLATVADGSKVKAPATTKTAPNAITNILPFIDLAPV